MRWVVTGAGGMLGTDAAAVLEQRGHEVVRLTRDQLDVRDPTACLRVLDGAEVVLNAAAWTDVDGAEGNEAEAFAVNAVGAANVARACAAHDAALVHVSTDYVFDGTATVPYPVDVPLSPLNAYGRGKAAGEWAVRAENPSSYVVRSAWLYGHHGPSFVATMLRLAGEGRTVEVVADQRGQPTWTVDLAAFIEELVGSDSAPGTYHGTSTGDCTWWDLARELFTVAGHDPDRVRPTTSEHYRRLAARPAYSVLANEGGMPTWQDGLRRALTEWPRVGSS